MKSILKPSSRNYKNISLKLLIIWIFSKFQVRVFLFNIKLKSIFETHLDLWFITFLHAIILIIVLLWHTWKCDLPHSLSEYKIDFKINSNIKNCIRKIYVSTLKQVYKKKKKKIVLLNPICLTKYISCIIFLVYINMYF